MSIFSTRDVTPDEARQILQEHLLHALGKAVSADPQQLDSMLNTYVAGNDEYCCTNFQVVS